VNYACKDILATIKVHGFARSALMFVAVSFLRKSEKNRLVERLYNRKTQPA
jgi:hypothetical protein